MFTFPQPSKHFPHKCGWNKYIFGGMKFEGNRRKIIDYRLCR